MIKRVAIYYLPDGTDPDVFWKYHIEVHTSDFIKAAGPALRKYVINRVTEVVTGKPKFWALVETWWESKEAMNEAFERASTFKTPDGKTIQDDFGSRVTDKFSALVEEKEITL